MVFKLTPESEWEGGRLGVGEMNCLGGADSTCSRSTGRQNLDNLALSVQKPKSGEPSCRSIVNGHGDIVKECGPYPGEVRSH